MTHRPKAILKQGELVLELLPPLDELLPLIGIKLTLMTYHEVMFDPLFEKNKI